MGPRKWNQNRQYDLFTLDLIIITLFDKKYLSSKALTELAFLGTVATKTVRIALVGHHI